MNRFVGSMSLAKALRSKPITRIEGVEKNEAGSDWVAVEEPLEIRVGGHSVAVVMRTPGHDRELAAGFLVSEGIVRRRDDVLDIVFCRAATTTTTSGTFVAGTALSTGEASVPRSPLTGETPNPSGMGVPPMVESGNPTRENVVDVLLAPGAEVDLARLTRHVFTSSSCGICSKASIEAVRAQFAPIAESLAPRREVLAALPDQLRSAQAVFAATGGLHASALFDQDGALELVREDVGRHNALDKILGHAFFAGRLPLRNRILLVSGRVSFELMQKALVAGIPCVAAISAPTTAAVEFAQASGQTLIGFLRGARMNVYAGTLKQ